MCCLSSQFYQWDASSKECNTLLNRSLRSLFSSISLFFQKTYLVYIPWHVYHNHACNSMQSSKVRCARSKWLPCWFEGLLKPEANGKKLVQFIIKGKEECYIEELLYHLFRRPIWFTFCGMFIITMHATPCNPPRSDEDVAEGTWDWEGTNYR